MGNHGRDAIGSTMDVQYCYYYGPYSKRFWQNMVQKTADFDKPITLTAKGKPKISSGKIVATCFASDFFIADADKWRLDAWAMIKQRPDLDSYKTD